jgi:hypothetical protein
MVMTEWQPIDTAPKDGTDVLIFCDDEIVIGSFAGGMWWFDQIRYEKHAPTHWMPLPAPPKKGDE